MRHFSFWPETAAGLKTLLRHLTSLKYTKSSQANLQLKQVILSCLRDKCLEYCPHLYS